jgi:hypothetical protein
VRRVLLLAIAIGGVTAAGAVSDAGATNECRGLQACVRVPGPWVVVPAALATPRPQVDFQLSCPRGYVIGGLDAELTDRAIDVTFGGKLGSPVNPGVTTARAAVFRASYGGTSPRGPSFRPHLGCLPTTGGGSGPVPYRRPGAVFPPGEPTLRRVRTVRLRSGASRVAVSCAAGERLLSAWHAVVFFTAQPPSRASIAGVRTSRIVRGRRVEVRAQASVVGAGVQVGAVCGGTA